MLTDILNRRSGARQIGGLSAAAWAETLKAADRHLLTPLLYRRLLLRLPP